MFSAEMIIHESTAELFEAAVAECKCKISSKGEVNPDIVKQHPEFEGCTVYTVDSAMCRNFIELGRVYQCFLIGAKTPETLNK